MGIISDIYHFVVEKKKWWLIPMIVVFAIIFIFVVIQNSPLSPFLYALF